MLQCVAVCCSVLQCVAVCCSVLQWVAVCCSVLQCKTFRERESFSKVQGFSKSEVIRKSEVSHKSENLSQEIFSESLIQACRVPYLHSKRAATYRAL